MNDVKEIKGFIYRITEQNMNVTFVECLSKEALYYYLASNVQFRVGTIAVHQLTPYDGLQAIDIYSDKQYQEIVSHYVVIGIQKVTNIKWDVDCKEDLYSLPTQIVIPEGMIDEDEISDYISDVTGYCHDGFDIEAVTTKVIYVE